MGPLPNGLYKWLINGGDPNHLLTGMILQVGGGYESTEVKMVGLGWWFGIWGVCP